MKICSMEMAIISFAANRCAMKGILIGITLVAISHSTGHYMLTTYAVMIFKIVDSPLLTPYMASILLAVALILGSLTTHLLADILGRRILIMTSLVGSAIGLFAMAIYDYLKLSDYNLSSFSYIPVMSLSFVIFISSAGIIPLSVLVCIENLSPKVRFHFVLSNVFYFFSKFLSQMFLQMFKLQIRNMSVAIIIFASNVTCFGFLKLFPPLLESLRLYGCMSICGILCILGTFFISIVVKETSGQCLDYVGSDKKRSNEHIHSGQEKQSHRVQKYKYMYIVYGSKQFYL